MSANILNRFNGKVTKMHDASSEETASNLGHNEIKAGQHDAKRQQDPAPLLPHVISCSTANILHRHYIAFQSFERTDSMMHHCY